MLSCIPTNVPPIWPTSCIWPHLNYHTHLSSGSSFSSFVGVILTLPFLARGQPDKLNMQTTKNKTKPRDLTGHCCQHSDFPTSEMKLILPSVGSVVSSHVPWTITTWGWTPGKRRNRARGPHGCGGGRGIMTHSDSTKHDELLCVGLFFLKCNEFLAKNTFLKKMLRYLSPGWCLADNVLAFILPSFFFFLNFILEGT